MTHEQGLAFAAISTLAQAQRHGEITFETKNQNLFQNLRTALGAAGIDVETLVNTMLTSEVIDASELKLSEADSAVIAALFQEAGRNPVLAS